MGGLVWVGAAFVYVMVACLVGWFYGRTGGENSDDWAPVIVMGWPLALPVMLFVLAPAALILLMVWTIEKGSDARREALLRKYSRSGASDAR